VILSSNPSAHAASALHPRAVTTTNSPEKLIDIVVEFVADRRRDQQPSGGGASWIDRLTGNQPVLTVCQPVAALANLTWCHSSAHPNCP
jgi:hypothetical protein